MTCSGKRGCTHGPSVHLPVPRSEAYSLRPEASPPVTKAQRRSESRSLQRENKGTRKRERLQRRAHAQAHSRRGREKQKPRHRTPGAARTPSRLKSSGDLRFLGRCPPVLGLVARQFLGWSPVSFCRESRLVRASSCFAAGCVRV